MASLHPRAADCGLGARLVIDIFADFDGNSPYLLRARWSHRKKMARISNPALVPDVASDTIKIQFASSEPTNLAHAIAASVQFLSATVGYIPMTLSLLELPGFWLAQFLSKPRPTHQRPATSRPEVFATPLKKGDVLLVEGSSRFATAVKYLTQSTWSHATLCIADSPGAECLKEEIPLLVEADVIEGVRTVPLTAYVNQHTRICRPVGLRPEEIDRVVDFVLARLGSKYDLKNVVDLARYLIQTPPVPARWRRRMLALGSGDPTRAICSSLIAQAFQSINYPILPEIVLEKLEDPAGREYYREILHIRHHSLFAPRDFDLSPYFKIIKPTIEQGFNPHALEWRSNGEPETSRGNLSRPA